MVNIPYNKKTASIYAAYIEVALKIIESKQITKHDSETVQADQLQARA